MDNITNIDEISKQIIKEVTSELLQKKIISHTDDFKIASKSKIISMIYNRILKIFFKKLKIQLIVFWDDKQIVNYEIPKN